MIKNRLLEKLFKNPFLKNPFTIASLALVFLFALSFSYGSRPPRGRALTKSPLLWAKLDGSLTDEVSSGSSFAYSPGKPSTASGISLKEGDNIQYSRGTAIDAGNSIYENWNPNQGTMNVWVEPNWNGGDNEAHWIWSADSGRIDTADANLQAYFKFDEGSEKFAFDSSSNSNVGYLHGPALSFDGGDYVNLSSTTGLDASVVSVEAWIKTSSDTSQTIFCATSSFANDYCLKLYSSGNVGFYIGPSNTDAKYVTGNWANGVWHHIVAVRDANIANVKIYIDGQIKSLSDPASELTLYNYTRIGARYIYEYFNGQIDEVRIYNRALSATEVGQHYAGTFANESGLVGYWNMDENQGQTVADSSGNGNNGTLGADSGSSTDDPTWVNYAPRWTEEGRFGEAVVFDGSDDELEINDINF